MVTHLAHVLVDLDADAGLGLQHLDRLTAAADHTAHQVLGAVQRLHTDNKQNRTSYLSHCAAKAYASLRERGTHVGRVGGVAVERRVLDGRHGTRSVLHDGLHHLLRQLRGLPSTNDNQSLSRDTSLLFEGLPAGRTCGSPEMTTLRGAPSGTFWSMCTRALRTTQSERPQHPRHLDEHIRGQAVT